MIKGENFSSGDACSSLKKEPCSWQQKANTIMQNLIPKKTVNLEEFESSLSVKSL